MHSTNVLSLLALAATTLAAPHRGYSGHKQGNVVYKTVVHTAYATVIAGQPQATPAPAPVPSAVPVPEVPSVAPVPISSAEPVAAPVTSAVVVTPTPEPVASSTVVVAPVETSAAPATGYMSTVAEYRAKLGLSALTQSSKLEANALKTAVDGNGQMVHELNPGSFAQVLAPGDEDNFQHVFVGGWLCERPDLSGLDGVCSTASSGWTYSSTGHADILTSKDYTSIGCGFADGIWACDLA